MNRLFDVPRSAVVIDICIQIFQVSSALTNGAMSDCQI